MRYYTWLVKLIVSAKTLCIALVITPDYLLIFKIKSLVLTQVNLKGFGLTYWHCRIFITLYFTLQSSQVAIENNWIVLLSYDWIFWFFSFYLHYLQVLTTAKFFPMMWGKLPAQNVVDTPNITPDCLLGSHRSRVWPYIILSGGREQPYGIVGSYSSVPCSGDAVTHSLIII